VWCQGSMRRGCPLEGFTRRWIHHPKFISEVDYHVVADPTRNCLPVRTLGVRIKLLLEFVVFLRLIWLLLQKLVALPLKMGKPTKDPPNRVSIGIIFSRIISISMVYILLTLWDSKYSDGWGTIYTFRVFGPSWYCLYYPISIFSCVDTA